MEKKPNFDELKSRLGFGIKFWLEFDKKSILGSGWATLLGFIEEDQENSGSLTLAAKKCGYSYKYAWNIINMCGMLHCAGIAVTKIPAPVCRIIGRLIEKTDS